VVLSLIYVVNATRSLRGGVCGAVQVERAIVGLVEAQIAVALAA
jgi:hypothetical protein